MYMYMYMFITIFTTRTFSYNQQDYQQNRLMAVPGFCGSPEGTERIGGSQERFRVRDRGTVDGWAEFLGILTLW